MGGASRFLPSPRMAIAASKSQKRDNGGGVSTQPLFLRGERGGSRLEEEVSLTLLSASLDQVAVRLLSMLLTSELMS
jgi:hypothetical protein